MLHANDWLRRQIASTLSHILVLQRAVEVGGVEPHALRRELDAAIGKLRLDEPGRALGFTPEHMRRVRLALVTAADEFTQRPRSRCDYTTPPPSGEVPLLQQKYFENTTELGVRFFAELKGIIDTHSPSPVEHAVLEVFALCIALGVRGMYESYDLDGYEAARARLFAKLRPTLALPPGGPPGLPPAPWPAAPRTRPLVLWAAGFTVFFAAALLYTYRTEIAHNAAELRERLDEPSASRPAET